MKKSRTLLCLILFFVWGCAASTTSRSLSSEDDQDDPNLNRSNSGNRIYTEKDLSGEKEQAQPHIDNMAITSKRRYETDLLDRFSQSNSANLSSAADTSTKAPYKKPSLRSASTSHKRQNRAILDEALEYCQVSQEFWQKGELENALDALDRAYSLILQVDTEDNLKLIQEKEDLRFTISRRILEIYASRHIVVNGQHNEIPLVTNRFVKDEIALLTGNERQFFIDSYRRSGLYRPYIVEELRKNGLPEVLSWLPLIESGFKVRALSKARALGLWQFISSTGYKFGLQRDFYIDERLDPIKSTAAAIGYLKELHQIFGDWMTVLAAYNCGEGRVLRDIRTQNINYLDNFWDLYEKLPQETARYVPRFLAVLHILNDPAKYGLENLPLDSAPNFETVMVNREVHINSIANAIGIPEEDLKNLNPELRYSILPKDPYKLLVPPGTKDLLLAEIDSLPLASLPTAAYASPRMDAYSNHRVEKGETLAAIAANYGTGVQRIREANDLRSDSLIAGNKLKIPLKGTIVPACDLPTAPKPKEPHATFHTVKQGDSLWNIARNYCTTTQKIQALNNLKSPHLENGQVLKISEQKLESQPKLLSVQKVPLNQKAEQKVESRQKPELKTEARVTLQSNSQSKEKMKTSTPQKTVKKYVVKKGDTIFTIAKKNNVPLENFMAINRITPNSKIRPGQELYIE